MDMENQRQSKNANPGIMRSAVFGRLVHLVHLELHEVVPQAS